MDWRWAFEQLHLAQRCGHSLQRNLERARTLMHEDPAALDLEGIARAAGLSRFHFVRVFRDAFGVTPHQYRLARRMERAQSLLLQGESVTETCFAVGYQSVGSFSSAFLRHVGHPPSQHRRRIFSSAELDRLPAIPSCFLAHFAPLGSTWAKPQESRSGL